MSHAKRARKNYGSTCPRFIQLEHRIVDSENYQKLTTKAVKLFIDMMRQYNGFNNGDLTATWSIMEKCGWRSRHTLYRALQELLYYEFLILTRQGGRNRCSLYALTTRSIDACKGKLEVPETRRASDLWKTDKPKYRPSSPQMAEAA